MEVEDHDEEPNASRKQASPPTSRGWGGDFHHEATIGASLVCKALKLCLTIQKEQLDCDEKIQSGKSVATTTARVDKLDGTPVTALDFAIQGYILSSLHRTFEDDSFLAEEDSNDFIESDGHCQQQALDTIRRLDPSMEMDAFINALDLSRDTCVSPTGKGDSLPNRCWILDPIDGTKGFLQKRQYAIGLAFCVHGEPIIGVIGNSSGRVMVAIRGHGLRYANETADRLFERPPDRSCDPFCSKPNNQHREESPTRECLPYVISMGPKPGPCETTGTYPTPEPPPRPFGPDCLPLELCCGSLVKYFAVAEGRVCGFLQFSSRSQNGWVKTWDHAAGIRCVLESGGSLMVVPKDHDDKVLSFSTDDTSTGIRFRGRDFRIGKAIVCMARETKLETRKRLLQCIQDYQMNH